MPKLCGNCSRILSQNPAQIVNLRRAPQSLRSDFTLVRNFQTSCIRVIAKIEYSCALEPSRFHLADHFLRKFRLNFTLCSEFCVVMSSVRTDFYCRYMGLRNISDSGLLGVTNGLDPLEE
ncbi:protein trichome birefringence-like 19 [Dorcoceras hygrometricum]|uniref:Protein trichome birefringence-like 19 n=1 Tax=Dorcoceras hygrometricum TaxID=472368 RepID=A0A2Z6ZXY3_9LAMI|nr:protein trichome birefringence-like 19 [Dorcoceras hygrometricum]